MSVIRVKRFRIKSYKKNIKPLLLMKGVNKSYGSQLVLDRINLERAKLGAIMSRMTKAIDNLSNVSMNTTESRGRIVDADFALESANLTRSQILQQSATAMIAQASRSMQTVLELLK